MSAEENAQILRDYEVWPKMDGVRLLWHRSYWDGPITGMCEANGERFWFSQCADYIDSPEYKAWSDKFDEDDDAEGPDWTWSRRYLCHRMTSEQQAQIEAGHAKWQRMVGMHTDYVYDENGKRSRGQYRHTDTITQATVDQYYAEARANPVPAELFWPATRDHVVGWFEL